MTERLNNTAMQKIQQDELLGASESADRGSSSPAKKPQHDTDNARISPPPHGDDVGPPRLLSPIHSGSTQLSAQCSPVLPRVHFQWLQPPGTVIFVNILHLTMAKALEDTEQKQEEPSLETNTFLLVQSGFVPSGPLSEARWEEGRGLWK